MTGVVKMPFYPTPPPKGSTRVEQMLFVRKNYIYCTVLSLSILIVGLVLSATVVLVIGAAAVLIEVTGAGVLELQMRAEHSRDRR